MSDDLVQFLRDRLSEDFEAVRRVIGVNVMAAVQDGKPVPRWVPSPKEDAGVWDTDLQPRVKFAWPRERDHIIRYDPARALAEVEAKRRMLEKLLGEGHAVLRPGGSTEVYCGADYGDGSPCDCGRDERVSHSLRVLASVYASHPDYRAEWRAGEDTT
ncbi:DUF6221 family protein [Streptomyces sp. NPDC050416]|uniref:DUF6221 family protein n=1 Tax=Streptomyces sp. NPDC050416 TaxID=3365611 RepID=UPI003789708F